MKLSGSPVPEWNPDFDSWSTGKRGRRPYNAFVLYRWPTQADMLNLRCKDSEHVFLSAGGQWCLSSHDAVCFLTEKAARIHLNRLPWKKREGLHITHVSGEL